MQLLKRDGTKTVYIRSSVKNTRVVFYNAPIIAVRTVMDMTVDHIAFRLMIPRHKRIVKQHQLTLAVRKFRIRLDSNKIFCKCGIAYPCAVVISDNKAFFCLSEVSELFRDLYA